MSDKTSSNSGGVTFLGLLTIVFITLKLTETIDWSWWWVLSPMLIPLAIALAGFAFAGLVWVVMKIHINHITKP